MYKWLQRPLFSIHIRNQEVPPHDTERVQPWRYQFCKVKIGLICNSYFHGLPSAGYRSGIAFFSFPPDFSLVPNLNTFVTDFLNTQSVNAGTDPLWYSTHGCSWRRHTRRLGSAWPRLGTCPPLVLWCLIFDTRFQFALKLIILITILYTQISILSLCPCHWEGERILGSWVHFEIVFSWVVSVLISSIYFSRGLRGSCSSERS